MAEIRYRIEPKSENPYMNGIAFIVAAVALYIPVALGLLASHGAIHLGSRIYGIIISLYAGLATMGCVLVFTIPVFKRASHSVNAVGIIKSFKSRIIRNRHISETAATAAVIEYEADGMLYQKAFGAFSFIGKKSVGDSVELLVEKKRPEKAMTRGYATFSGWMIVPLLFMPLFAPILIFLWCIPVIARAKRSVKTTGKIVEFTIGRHDYSPSVEYKHNGKVYVAQLDTWSSVRPIIGGRMKIKIDERNPDKIISMPELVFSIFATVIFCAAGLLFASLGFFANMDSVNPSEIPLLGYVIPFGFISFFLMIGIIYCLRVKSKLSKAKLRETGVPVSCVIEKFSVDTFTYIQGKHPAKLSCSGGGKTFELKTNIHPQSNNIHKGARIMVYVDQMNEKRFFVDLSSVRDDF